MSWLSDLLKEYPALSVAQERLALHEERYENLKQENEKLAKVVADLTSEKEQLEARLKELEAKAAGKLNELEVSVLTLLAAETRRGDGMHAEEIARPLDVAVPRAEHFLSKLDDEGYLSNSLIMNRGIFYYLGDRGRAIFVENDLI